MKSVDILQLARPHIRSLKPYSSARDEFSGEAKVFIDANENPFGLSDGNAYNRYPDPYQKALKEAISAIKGLPHEQIFIGNGSDEPIDLLIRAFCEPGKDIILLVPPTYGMYGVSAEVNHVRTVQVPLTSDYQLDVERVLEQLNDKVKLTFLCSPNNPTGNSLRISDMERVLEKSQGLVVVDEAYIDFSSQESMVSLMNKYSNLVVLQTLSKAWGLAGIRLGMAFAQPELVTLLNRIKPPYNISTLTQEEALKSIQNREAKEAQVKRILEQRIWLENQLTSLSIVKEVYPSDANFLLVKVGDATKTYHDLLSLGIVVRNRTNVQLCEGCLRITVGTEEENRLLIDNLLSYSS